MIRPQWPLGRVAGWIVGSALSMLSLALALGVWGLKVNLTPSVPLGFYRIDGMGKTVQRGDYVLVCPPVRNAAYAQAMERGYFEPGFCPSGVMPLLKRVAALAGDLVEVSPQGIFVEGRPWPESRALAKDGNDQPLLAWPLGLIRLSANQVWIMGENAEDSFDSRYMGPLPAQAIRATVNAIWQFER